MDPGPIWMCIQDILLANVVLCLLPCEAPAQYYTTLPRAEQAHTCPHHHVDVSLQSSSRDMCRSLTWWEMHQHVRLPREGPGSTLILETRRAAASELYQALGKYFLLQRAPNAWKGAGKVSWRHLSLPNGNKRAVHVPTVFNPACGFASHDTPSFFCMGQ